MTEDTSDVKSTSRKKKLKNMKFLRFCTNMKSKKSKTKGNGLYKEEPGKITDKGRVVSPGISAKKQDKHYLSRSLPRV